MKKQLFIARLRFSLYLHRLLQLTAYSLLIRTSFMVPKIHSINKLKPLWWPSCVTDSHSKGYLVACCKVFAYCDEIGFCHIFLLELLTAKSVFNEFHHMHSLLGCCISYRFAQHLCRVAWRLLLVYGRGLMSYWGLNHKLFALSWHSYHHCSRFHER